MPPSPHTLRAVIRWAVCTAAVVLAILIGAAVSFLPGDEAIRHRIERTLSSRFDADVSLADLHVSLVPRPRVEGGGLRLTPRGRPGARPLLVVSRFRARANWRDAFRRPRRVADVDLEGLRITIEPKPGDTGVRDKEHGGCQGERRHSGESATSPADSPVLIERLRAPGTEIELLPRKPAKQPRRFSIRSLDVRNITLDQPLDFDAVLTNPTPRGVITAHGRFGPWVRDDPGLAPVGGRYLFERVNLDTIRGIGGTLTSKGRFAGLLEQILVSGATETPDFSLDTARYPMPLHTDFEACVDGTDGDTYLDSVTARLASTTIFAKGKVEGRVGEDGRTVALDVAVNQGNIEDLLRLVVKAEQPLMTGPVSLTHTLLLPPGPASVVERLQLKGQFRLERTHFTGQAVREKVDEFSRRGQGRPQDASVSDVASHVAGRFTLANASLRLSDLSFTIPGARVALHGTYGLLSEQIAFEGAVRLRAKASQTTSGFKSVLLRAIDPLLARKNAGTVLPIRISGTREHPKFGVDVKGVLTGKAK